METDDDDLPPQPPGPTPRQAQFMTAMDARIGEHLDGYILLGFVAGTGELCKMTRCPDKKTNIALRSVLNDLVFEINSQA